MTSSWGGSGPTAPQSAPQGSNNRARKPSSRILLSCTKCRERKVKCDRTKPCQACCARGCPKECEFKITDHNEYQHVTQSYEIRKLRDENEKMKQRIQYLESKVGQQIYSGDSDEEDGRTDRRGSTATSRAAAARQRRFKTSNRIDNLYFGTPSLANVVQDFSHLQLGTQSLTHTLPKGKDMYAPEDTAYPFHILAGFSSLDSLVELLPPPEELFSYLDLFQRNAQSCSVPQTSNELPMPRSEVERFLEDGHRNASNSPDALALLFAMIATGMQVGSYDRNGGEWVEGAVEESRQQSDVYISASMQALRIASFMSRPTLCAIQTLVMIGPYLTNSGRFLDAWTLFGTTVRLAHSVGLHRKPSLLDPAPSIRESATRQTLWWWILHMDQQYSVTLGRPLGISGIGDCPPPSPLTTNQTMLRLGEFIDKFTILARQILASNDMMNISTIDGFTEKLIGLWDTMPEALQFTEHWIQPKTQLPEWPLDVMAVNLYVKVQSFLILLNRQRLEKTSAPGSPVGHSRSGWTSSSSEAPASRAPQKGRPLVVDACIRILQAFMYFYYRRKGMLICWTMGQQAFNACMIIILDALETGLSNEEFWVNQAWSVFVELHNKGVHQLAELAVKRISAGLLLLESRRPGQGQMMSFSQGQPPNWELDTASLTDFSVDTVMGNTGMFLLEDPGSQFYNTQPPNFRTMEWMMPSNAHTSNPSRPQTPGIPSPQIPLSDINPVPFPVMSPPTVPVTNGPYAIGLQHRMPVARSRMPSFRHPSLPHPMQTEHQHHQMQAQHTQTEFTPINTQQQHHPHQQQQQQQQQIQQQSQQQSFPHHRGPVRQPHGHHSSSRSNNPSGTGSRSQLHGSSSNGHGNGSGQRLERVGKSHRRR